MVRKERLELSHLAAPEPKSGASTNFATSAQIVIDNPNVSNHHCKWQVYLDSNQGMAASKAAALPLGDRPADASQAMQFIKAWCGRRDLNSHTLRRQNLNLVRLPISPLPHKFFR